MASPPTETRPRFYEAHDLIMKAWTQPGPFPYNGRFNKLRYVNPWPQPLQKPHPPVWLAGGGSVETYEMAVNFDYTYSFLSFFGYQFAKKVMDTFWDTVDRLGADQNPYRAGFAQQICVSETDAQGGGGLPRARCLLLQEVPAHPALLPRDSRLPDPPEHGVRPQDGPAGRNRRRAHRRRRTGSSLVDKGFIIAGSPETVADRLIEACRGPARRVTSSPCSRSARCRTSSPSRTCTLFAEGVMPKLRSLWADEGWEHKWWPQGARQDSPRRAGDCWRLRSTR